MSLLYFRIFSCHNTVNPLFFLFEFITIENAFKMAFIQVLVNSISLYITTLTGPVTWTVIYLFIQTFMTSIHNIYIHTLYNIFMLATQSVL